MMKSPFDNDRLSHWFAGALLSWTVMFSLVALPIFNLWLRVPVARIATFVATCCAIQFAVTPWLFSARATPQNPSGRVTQRAVVVTVLFCLISLLFFHYVRLTWPDDIETRRFTSVAMALTIPFGIAILIRLVSRHRRVRQTNRHTSGDP